uniref:Protein kinase domain-containing protein n=1 Tax=Hemiselmis andersenii TaxID=464988 RepID=A0A7S1DEQ9_HEMAN|mmetsp:Transcript_1056/g.2623  ORF Transcript_1056/g.2623 Transcript_1056/m.2623 type:complete len:283 (+) Transcript_1056:89-937(+)
MRDKGDKFADDTITLWMVGLTRALDHIHQEVGISHNNISMSSILFDDRGVLKLGSFLPRAACLHQAHLRLIAFIKRSSSGASLTRGKSEGCTASATAGNSAGGHRRVAPIAGTRGSSSQNPLNRASSTLQIQDDGEERASDELVTGGEKYSTHEDMWKAGAVLLELCTMMRMSEHSGLGQAVAVANAMGKDAFTTTASLMMTKNLNLRITAEVACYRFLQHPSDLRLRDRIFVRWAHSTKRGVSLGSKATYPEPPNVNLNPLSVTQQTLTHSMVPLQSVQET